MEISLENLYVDIGAQRVNCYNNSLFVTIDDSLHNVPLSSGVLLLSHCPRDPN